MNTLHLLILWPLCSLLSSVIILYLEKRLTLSVLCVSILLGPVFLIVTALAAIIVFFDNHGDNVVFKLKK